MSSFADQVVTRLGMLVPATFKVVDGARAYLTLASPPIDKMPAAYVLPFSESYGPNTLINGVRQTGPEEVAVVIMVAVKPGIGADVHNPIHSPRAALVAQLLGWQPDAADGAVLLSSGELLDARPTHLSYQLNFKRDHTERGA